MPCSNVMPKPSLMACWPISTNACFTTGSKRPVCATSIAKAIAPTILATKTMSQSRSTRIRVLMSGWANKGKMAVIVFSVDSCSLKSTTIRKPTLYPKLAMSGRQGAAGIYARMRPWATSEKPIESPAARPDQARAVGGRRNSRSPSSRTASCTTIALIVVRRSTCLRSVSLSSGTSPGLSPVDGLAGFVGSVACGDSSSVCLVVLTQPPLFQRHLAGLYSKHLYAWFGMQLSQTSLLVLFTGQWNSDLGEKDFESRLNDAFAQMAAVGAIVLVADGDVRVDVRRSVQLGDVADQADHFDLLCYFSALVLLALCVVVFQFGLAKPANRAQPSRVDMLLIQVVGNRLQGRLPWLQNQHMLLPGLSAAH